MIFPIFLKGFISQGLRVAPQALREAESKLAEVTTSGKGPRIGALDSLRPDKLCTLW